MENDEFVGSIEARARTLRAGADEVWRIVSAMIGWLIGLILAVTIRLSFPALVLLAWALFARTEQVRDQNYKVCDAQSAAAFAHDNTEDMVGSTSRITRDVLYRLQDDVRVTCMAGKGYVRQSDVASSGFVCMGGNITPSDCFQRTLYSAAAAQIK